MSLFLTITPEIAKRYLEAGKAQKNDVSRQIGEAFSARLREEDISDWIGPDEETDDEDEELPENA